MAFLNERGYDEHIISEDPQYRERNIGLWARAGQSLGVNLPSTQVIDISAITVRQDTELKLLQEQNQLLRQLVQKDNDVYLDSKMIYESNEKHRKQEINDRNIFKGVTPFV